MTGILRKTTPTAGEFLMEQLPELLEDELGSDSVTFETSVGIFVCHADMPLHEQYFMFRPGHDQLVAEIAARERSGDAVDWDEAARATRRFGELMLAFDDMGFSADLYLDRDVVAEDEIPSLIQGTCEFLEQLPLGSDGGSLAVYWTEQIELLCLDVESDDAQE